MRKKRTPKIKRKKRTPKIKFDKVILRIGKLTVRPGDYIVMKTDLMLDKDQTQALRDRVDEQFKDLGVKVIILTCGLSIAVVRKEEVPPGNLVTAAHIAPGFDRWPPA